MTSSSVSDTTLLNAPAATFTSLAIFHGLML
ncbi:hypothetical protein PANA5342_4150 [Pantoea ananatis LMG 5342]|nr:hypothetical protein PANA5342_4150 [Pantoea ananatis LMG 5342]